MGFKCRVFSYYQLVIQCYFLFYKLNKLNNGIYSIYNALRVMNQCKQFPACFINQCT